MNVGFNPVKYSFLSLRTALRQFFFLGCILTFEPMLFYMHCAETCESHLNHLDDTFRGFCLLLSYFFFLLHIEKKNYFFLPFQASEIDEETGGDGGEGDFLFLAFERLVTRINLFEQIEKKHDSLRGYKTFFAVLGLVSGIIAITTVQGKEIFP